MKKSTSHKPWNSQNHESHQTHGKPSELWKPWKPWDPRRHWLRGCKAMDTRGLLSIRSVFSFCYMQWLIYFINSLSFKVNAFQFLIFLNAFIREAGRDLCFLLYLLAVYATMCYIFLNGYYVLDFIGHVSNDLHGHLLINMFYQFFSAWTRIFSYQLY